jgi:lipopolysaccharide export system protein LptA
MARIIRICGSFSIVLVAYWAYALVAVPLIEPSADRQQSDQLSEEALRNRVHAAKERWRKELEGLFPPDSPLLENNPKIVEIDQVKLLIEDYTRLDDGKKVEICPCTMIFMPDGSSADAAERRRRSVILEASKAVLEFDQPFVLRQAKVGRLISGKLEGRITIRSQGRSPGPEDDLLVVTRDVDLNEERIWTEHPVDFRLGANYGRGRQMWIKLLPGDEDEGTERRGPNVAGIELFEIRHLEQLHLRFGEEEFVPGVEKKTSPRAAPGKSDLASDLPIEVKCRGPFRFDPIQQVATFEDHVDVLRVHPEGPSDQINCETLTVYFARPRKGAPTGAKEKPDASDPEASQALDLQPRRIEARGTPVVVRAPSHQLDARSERLEYDFESGRIVLDGSEEVFLKHGADEIHARNLQYQSSDDGRLGEAMAEGPGWLRAQVDEKLGQQLSARWGELLHLRPFEGQPVISLTGGAALEYGYIGQMTAGEIHLYLHESPPDEADQDDQPRLRPDRMVALHQVRPNSLQLSGALEEWKVWFVDGQPAEVPEGARGDAAVDVARADRTGSIREHRWRSECARAP